jgi:apolipoprotein N-acyltransferase
VIAAFARRVDPVLFWAALSGALLALAFPRPDLFPCAWFGLIPLLLVMDRRPLAAGFTAGLVFFALVLYWLNIVMTTYGGMPPAFSLLAYCLLVIYLALYWGVAAWLSVRLRIALQLPYLLTLPLLWVALEYLRGLLLTGFPWALLGYSQQNFSWTIQSADVTGVYGISFLLVAVNCALAWIIVTPRLVWSRLGFAGVLLLTVSHVGYGAWRSSQPLEQRSDQLQVALIQGNIDQARKWDPANRKASIDRYLDLSRRANVDKVDLTIWPEAATPFYFQEDTELARKVRQLPEESGSALLLGSPAYERDTAGAARYFNSAYLLSAEGRFQGRSDKVHLVPFGEYVPLSGLLSFVDKLVVGVGDFSSGQIRPLPLDGRQLGLLICYEAIFPELARAAVLSGSDLLVNLTNDAWFGHSSAPYQHLAMSRFRAIENRIWLARAANTGISALISPAGRLVQSGPLFKPFYLTGSVGLGAAPSFYTRFGDLFAWGCLALSGLQLAALLWVTRRRIGWRRTD